MQEILKILETLARKKPVGTLILGRRKRSCEIFVEEELLYFPGDQYLGKIDLEGLTETRILNDRVSPTAVETIALGMDLSRSILPEALHSRGLINTDELEELAHRHFHEEIFARFLLHRESVHFLDGHVPDSLIGRTSVSTRYPTHIPIFIRFVRERISQQEQLRDLIPSDDEVFVVTEKGMGRKQEARGDFGLQQILDLLDGFRTLRSVIQDGFLFQFYVLRRIAEALEAGWIKKTVMPELRGIDPSKLSPLEATGILVHFKNAIKHSVDEIKARENLASVYERMGKVEEAAIQHNFIGDTLYQMGRKARAIQAYQKALSIKRGDPLVTEKIVRIYSDSAREALRSGHEREAVALYRNALQFQPDHPESLRSLLEVLIAHNSLSEITSLCDMVLMRCPKGKSGALVIEMLGRVLARYPREVQIHKKLINLYIDLGRTVEGINEMEKLARLYASEGRVDQSMELVEKILRADPGREHLRKLSRPVSRPRGLKKNRPRGRRLLVRSVLALLLGFSIYQFWCFWGLRPLREHRYLAYASADWGGEDKAAPLEPTRLEQRLQALAEQAGNYQVEHPASIFLWEAEWMRRKFSENAAKIEQARNQKKDGILQAGLELIHRGNFSEGREHLKALLSAPEGDLWREKAEKALAANNDYEQRAEEVLNLAAKARADGNPREAYRLLTRLHSEYPLSTAVRKATFPVEIVTVPLRATATARSGKQAETPCWFDIAPNSVEEIQIELPGYEKHQLQLRAMDGPTKVILLRQVPFWLQKMPSAGYCPPVFRNDRVFHITQKSEVYALDLAGGKTIWVHSSPPVIQPVAPPLITSSHLLLPFNNGRILRFQIDSGAESSLPIEGLITTPLITFDDGKTVIFGNSRNHLTRIDMETGAALAAIPLEGTPVRLTACAPGAVAGITSAGMLFYAETSAKMVLWKASIPEKVVRGPIFIEGPGAGTILLVTDTSQLIAVEPAGGRILWQREAPSRNPASRTVAILHSARRLLLSEGDDAILEIEPVSGKELRRLPTTPFLRPFSDVVELPLGLGWIGRDGSFFLIDPATAAPRWSFLNEKVAIRSAASDARTLILVDGVGVVRAFAILPR